MGVMAGDDKSGARGRILKQWTRCLVVAVTPPAQLEACGYPGQDGPAPAKQASSGQPEWFLWPGIIGNGGWTQEEGFSAEGHKIP